MKTELTLYEHTTDTSGYTELIFAFFDLLGFMFSPRIRDLGNQNLYRYNKDIHYKKIDEILKGSINTKKIFKQWDTFLRIMASLKLGWVTASLFISKLQSQPKQSTLTKALQEYGRLVKSIYIPRYICREEQQRRVSLQLNKGEALHSLRQWLMFAEEGQIKKSQLQDQANQASALTLVTNAIIVWNTQLIHKIAKTLHMKIYFHQRFFRSLIIPCLLQHFVHKTYSPHINSQRAGRLPVLAKSKVRVWQPIVYVL